MGDILKEAIADAKAVRETALQNANHSTIGRQPKLPSTLETRYTTITAVLNLIYDVRIIAFVLCREIVVRLKNWKALSKNWAGYGNAVRPTEYKQKTKAKLKISNLNFDFGSLTDRITWCWSS